MVKTSEMPPEHRKKNEEVVVPQEPKQQAESDALLPSRVPVPPRATPQGSSQAVPAQTGLSVQPSQGNGLAVASMVLGIVGILGGFFLGVVLGILAVIFGAVARGKIKRGEAPVSGQAMATTGLALGIIDLCLLPVWFVLGLLTFGICLI